jgi:hypothetical protein
LIRASQFISQYPNVKVVYRPGKDHVNADALSRLTQLKDQPNADPREEEGGIYGFLITVVGVSMSTLRALEDRYVKDPHLSLIYDNIKRKMKIQDDFTHQVPGDDAIVRYSKLSQVDKIAPEEIEYNGFQGRLLYNHVLLYIIDPSDKHP